MLKETFPHLPPSCINLHPPRALILPNHSKMRTLQASSHHDDRGRLSTQRNRWGRNNILFKQLLTVKTCGMNLTIFITSVLSVTSERVLSMPKKTYCINCPFCESDAKDWLVQMSNDLKRLWNRIRISEFVRCFILCNISNHRVTHYIHLLF